MLNTYFEWVISFSVVVAALTGVYCLFASLAQKRISAKWIYSLGIFCLVVSAFPVLRVLELLTTKNTVDTIGNSYTSVIVQTSSIYAVWNVISYIWAIGIIVVVGIILLRHFKFVKTINRWSEPINDKTIIKTLKAVRDELNISKDIELLQCELLAGPILTGLAKPMIILPKIDLSEDEIYYALKHECVHYKNHDLIIKYLSLLAVAVQWYNPFIYIWAKYVAIQCELSCDEQVVTHFDIKQRQMYLESIIAVIRKNKMQLRTPLSTNYYGGKSSMEKRIKSVMGGNKKKMGIVISIAIIVFIAFVVISSFFIARFWNYSVPEGDGTKIEFVTSTDSGTGFFHELEIYTNRGITSIALSGKITVDGTAEVKIISNDTGSVVYTETFTSVNDKTVKINLSDLAPNAYYTITFSSEDAENGKLILEGKQGLVKSPDKPEVPAIPKK